MTNRRAIASALIAKAQTESFRQVKAVRQRLSARPSGSRPLASFVSGVHRSGTNMLMKLLDASYETTVYYESDPRAFDGHIMRPEGTIRSLIMQSAAKVVVIKALQEAHCLAELLERFAPAKAFWVIRRFEDVVNSSLHHWPGWRNKLESLVTDRGTADWRGLGMTDETHAVLQAHYRPELSDASATALFWYYRNQLFFDQEFERDPGVFTLLYDEAVRSPRTVARRIGEFLGIRSTASMERIAQIQQTPSLPSDIAPDVRKLCGDMQERLLSAHTGKSSGHDSAGTSRSQVTGLA